MANRNSAIAWLRRIVLQYPFIAGCSVTLLFAVPLACIFVFALGFFVKPSGSEETPVPTQPAEMTSSPTVPITQSVEPSSKPMPYPAPQTPTLTVQPAPTATPMPTVATPYPEPATATNTAPVSSPYPYPDPMTPTVTDEVQLTYPYPAPPTPHAYPGPAVPMNTATETLPYPYP